MNPVQSTAKFEVLFEVYTTLKVVMCLWFRFKLHFDIASYNIGGNLHGKKLNLSGRTKEYVLRRLKMQLLLPQGAFCLV